MSFIYKITNNVNNKVYIGKTSLSSIESRFRRHVLDSRKSYVKERPLYDAMNKYGVSNFSVEELESNLTDEQASLREVFWIEHFNSYIGFKNSNGYNATLGGDGKHWCNYQEIANKYLELQNQKEVAEFFNCDVKTVRVACEEFNISIISSGEIQKNTRGMKIALVDNAGNIKKLYRSQGEAAINYYGDYKYQKRISEVVNNKIKTFRGDKWIRYS